MNKPVPDDYFQSYAKRFVSTVLLIDDQLVFEEKNSNVSKLNIPKPGEQILKSINTSTSKLQRKVFVNDIMTAFSNEELLLSPVNPQYLNSANKSDCTDKLIKLAAKADVIILDWDMSLEFQSEKVNGSDLSSFFIQELNKDDKYRLLVIYTAEQTHIVKESLSQIIQHGNSNVDLKIYSKSSVTNLDPISYRELAHQVINDYLSTKKGLLAAALLSALSSLRSSTYLMLNSLQQNFDEALIYHRFLLPEPWKVEDFCSDLLMDEILCHLDKKSIQEILAKDILKQIINERNIIVNTDINIDELLEKGLHAIPSNKKKDITRGKNLSLIVPNEKQDIMKAFSYYTTMIIPKTKPHLHLGCVVKQDVNFYLCIQPPCDSERIPQCDSSDNYLNPRDFIFLELEAKNDNVSFFIKEANNFTGVKINYKKIKTFPFSGDKTGVVSLNLDDKYQIYGSDLQSGLKFICCLKPMFAQKIANEFAASISRIGIDQFEWLRLQGRQ